MKGTSRCRHAAATGGTQDGFSLVEVMITLVISSILVVGMYQSFNTMQRWWKTVSSKSDMSQNARAGLETFTRDIEMAGYQTTKYGDSNKLGLAVTLADTNRIEVDQQRLDIAAGTYVPRLVYYRLATDANTGHQNLYRQIRTTPGVPTTDQIVAENVATFSLSYYGCNQLPPNCTNANTSLNASLPQQYQTGVAPPEMLKKIRRIEVSISTTTPSTYIGAPAKPVTLTASVTPQNLTSDESSNDTSPPATPGGVAAWDNRSCTDKLQVRWNKNAEPDLAGYRIYYGASGVAEIPLHAVASQTGTTISYRLNPTDLNITKDADRGTASLNNKIDIQLQAYDSSGNESAKSTIVSGPEDPNTDVTAYSATANDTTVNPLKPSPPASLAVDGATAGKLVLSWPPSSTATEGYRIYRSETAFPVGATATISPSSTVKMIASESDLASAANTFTDQGSDLAGGLLSCKDYFYAITAVNCDETLVATYRNPASGSDYALASGQFSDNTPPPPPSLDGTIAGYNRIFITLSNPTTEECEDFDRTMVWFNKGSGPGPHLDGTVVAGTPPPALIPNSDPDNTGSRGTFRGRGTQTTVVASETSPTTYASVPDLINNDASGNPLPTPYNLLAVSYDRCGNMSAGTVSSKTIVMCGDDSEGPPPGSPSNPTYTSCQLDTVQLGWQYDYKLTLLDFAGYHIERTGPASSTVELTSGPTWAESWTDSGDLQAGGAYTYSIRASDCVYENKHADFPSNRSLPLTIGPLYPGSLQKYVPPPSADPLDAVNFVTTISDVPSQYTYHNNVKLHLQNTSYGTLTLVKMAVTWENPNVVLTAVTIGGSPGSTPEQTYETGGIASGESFTFNKQILDTATGVGYPSGAVPVLLRFATPLGGVTRLTDMRAESLDLALWLENDSIQPSACVDPDHVTIDVPKGPVIGGFAHDRTAIAKVDSYAVVGEAGTARDTDLQVKGDLSVNVYGTVFDNSGELFADGVDLGFATGYPKLVGATADPADSSSVPVMPASTFTRTLFRTVGNDYAIYKTTPAITGEKMPAVSEKVNWYYALAVDVTGNWDRDPNPDIGNFAYYQLSSATCTAPQPPSSLFVISTPRTALIPVGIHDRAVLSWTRPTLYVDGTSIPIGTTILYDVYRNDNGTPPFTEVLVSDLTATTWTYETDLYNSASYFVVVAKNNCASHNASEISNVGRECVGAGGVYCSMFDVPASATIGEPFTVTLSNACLYSNGVLTDKVNFKVVGVETKYILAGETTDGTFAAAITPRAGATTLPNEVRGSTAFTVSLWDNGSTKSQLPAAPAAQCQKTVTLTASGCSTYPSSPTPVNARSMNKRQATVTWGASTSSPDALGGYQVAYKYQPCTNYRSGRCRNWGTEVDYGSSTAVASGTTYTYTALGNTVVTRYKFRVRAKDTCSTGPNYSSWVESRDWLQVNP